MEDLGVTAVRPAAAAHLFGDWYRGRRVLVTGHTGFKGSWLSAWLLELGAEVVGFSDGVPTEPSLFRAAGLAGRLRHETGDIRDGDALARIVGTFRPAVVFHLAAQAIVSTSFRRPLDTITTNVVGTAVVLDVLRETAWPCAGVIVTSDKVYDNVEWVWGYRETDRLGGKDVYSASKAGAELAVSAYSQSFFPPDGLVRLATARAGNVIGGGDWAADRIVPDAVRAWSAGERVRLRNPRATRPWQHVLEPLGGYLHLGRCLASDETLHGASFNLGPSAAQNAAVASLLSGLAAIWGFASPDEAWEATGAMPFREAGLLKLDIDKARAELGWEPTLTYEEGLRFTGEWYRDVLTRSVPADDLTTRQIAEYGRLAAERGRVWAR